MPGHVLGIDIGTGGTRALIIRADGRIVASATEEHEPFASLKIGWAEQHPEDWWRAAGIAVRKALSQSGLKSEDIACVGFSGQMHGAVMLDANGDVVRPALIWCDVRTEPQCEELNRKIGAEKLIQLTCNPALPNFTLTKFLWVRENEPENWKRVRSVMLPKDYVRFRLTGERAIDVADASGTLDARCGEARVVAGSFAGGGDRCRVAAARVRIAGRLRQSFRRRREGDGLGGWHAGCRWRWRSGRRRDGHGHRRSRRGQRHDRNFGRCVCRDGSACARSSRAASHVLPRRSRPLARHGRHAGRGAFAALVPRQLHVRPRRNPARTDPYETLTAEAATAPAGSDGLLWTPYLMGERTPHLDGNARGALVGLTASHKRAHVVRAILEGVAYSLKDTFTIFGEMNVPVKSIRLGGGGARSPLWRQIQADVYDHDVEIVEAEEGAAYGAAILAGVGAEIWPSVDAACDAVVRVMHRVQPVAENARVMQTNYAAYRRVYPATKSIFSA